VNISCVVHAGLMAAFSDRIKWVWFIDAVVYCVNIIYCTLIVSLISFSYIVLFENSLSLHLAVITTLHTVKRFVCVCVCVCGLSDDIG